MGLFDRLHGGLSKTRVGFGTKVLDLLMGRHVDEEMFEELEEALILADIGVSTACELVDSLRQRARNEKIKEGAALQAALIEEITSLLEETGDGETGLSLAEGKLNIVLLMGVNGAGKTTTIGKIALREKASGKKVILAAADTFRAAAADQLAVWAQRADCDIIRQNEGGDPGAVVFDACRAAIARKADLLLVDTAGRLQNKANLMSELGKICKIIEREAPEAARQTLLVLDSTTGQNAISQAKLFGEVAKLDGLVLTKLDGTAKGGVVIGIGRETGLPVRLIGVGEGIEDLQDFNAYAFAKALFAE